MNNILEIKGVLRKLIQVLNDNIEGDVVELGCNKGGTSIWIRRILDIYKNKFNIDKEFHVYDSWEGVPDKHYNDYSENFENDISSQINGKGEKIEIEKKFRINQTIWKKGTTKTSLDVFKNNFTQKHLKLPHIHSGFFKNIPDIEYPEKICFAFFDGDFYTSIMDSFDKVYSKITSNGIIVIDDCGDNTLIGVKQACIEFLLNKPEELQLDAYPTINGEWKRNKDNLNICFWGGWIKKL